MSLNTADPIQSNGHKADDSIAAKFDSFMNVVSDTFEDLGVPENQLEEIEDRGRELGEEIEDRVTDNSNHDLRENTQQLQQQVVEGRKSAAADRQRIHALEERIDEIEDSSQGRAGDDSTDGPTSTDETTALEEVCSLPEQVADESLTVNQQRARSLARRIDEYGKVCPAGIAITSSRIKRVLTAQEDSTIHRQTVQRVAQFLKKFGDGRVKIKKTRSGKMTVVFDEELANDVTGVVTANTDSSVTTAAIT